MQLNMLLSFKHIKERIKEITFYNHQDTHSGRHRDQFVASFLVLFVHALPFQLVLCDIWQS